MPSGYMYTARMRPIGSDSDLGRAETKARREPISSRQNFGASSPPPAAQHRGGKHPARHSSRGSLVSRNTRRYAQHPGTHVGVSWTNNGRRTLETCASVLPQRRPRRAVRLA
ncbi:hypothetical protein DICSQDRAFT_134046, partial [Dichomitus squalens LYAD-421 SS1]|uniref:uncharacterized protein n=1 Tax=Dichomitus squalens (strain LYAD-421) TaxID=732165 RepID=UPI0004413F8F